MDTIAEFGREAALGAQAELDRLALLIAAGATPDLDVEAQRARLDDLAVDFGGSTAAELMGWMRIRGFRGNATEYYDPENSFLDRVMDRGLGIPISLSVLSIEVGRRCGVELVGVGLPGEFIVAERDQPDRFHNPFRHLSMSAADVTELVRRFAGPEATLTPDMVRPVPPVAVAARMLTNLAHIYGHTDQAADLAWVLRLQAMLPGAPPSIRRRLVATLADLGRFWEAAAELSTLIDLASATATPAEREADAAMLRRLRSRLN